MVVTVVLRGVSDVPLVRLTDTLGHGSVDVRRLRPPGEVRPPRNSILPRDRQSTVALAESETSLAEDVVGPTVRQVTVPSPTLRAHKRVVEVGL